jgi:hypothetical protein
MKNQPLSKENYESCFTKLRQNFEQYGSLQNNSFVIFFPHGYYVHMWKENKYKMTESFL